MLDRYDDATQEGVVNSETEGFIRKFRAAAADGTALEAIAADVVGFSRSLADQPDDLDVAMAKVSDAAGGVGSVPAEAFAAAACTADGCVLAADPSFVAWEISEADLADAVKRVTATGPRLSAIARNRHGQPVALAIATASRAGAWPLSDGVRAAVDGGPGRFAILGARAASDYAWPDILAAWRFTRSETRLLGALVRSGDLRAAASDAGIGYETARKVVASAMAKTGARRQPELIRDLAMLAYGELPARDLTWRTFADAYQLTHRQAQLAQLVAVGLTRQAAASQLRISMQTAKAELKIVFEICQIGSAAALGQLVAEVDALTRLAAAADVEIVGRGNQRDLLRFVRRRASAGRIAVQDHGPPENLPVICFHTPTTGRHQPAVLVRALQARGLRPISIERPGFGLTSEAAGDPVADAASDVRDVLDELGLAQVRLLGRSCVMAIGFAAAYPERVSRGVLLSTAPPGMRPTRGLFGRFGDLAIDTPWMVAGFARLLVRFSSDTAIMRIAERGLGDCPADIAAFADPANRSDYIRATRQLSTSAGLARELAIHAAGVVVPPAAAAVDWTIVIGARDALVSNPELGRAAWQAALPSARVVVYPEGGRFMHMSHAADIATLLVD
jgi:pimeloyl-ACP methyl ester carboxylesterase